MAICMSQGIVGPMGPAGRDGLIDESLVEYVDLLFNLMGVDITYKEFKMMSESEKRQFTRDLKIKKVINEL